jgi:hypothetical protein
MLLAAVFFAGVVTAQSSGGFLTLEPPSKPSTSMVWTGITLTSTLVLHGPAPASISYTTSTQVVTVLSTRAVTLPYLDDETSIVYTSAPLVNVGPTRAKGQEGSSSSRGSDWLNQIGSIANSAMSSMTLHKSMRIKSDDPVILTTFVAVESTIYEDVNVTVVNASPTDSATSSSIVEQRDAIRQHGGRYAIL